MKKIKLIFLITILVCSLFLIVCTKQVVEEKTTVSLEDEAKQKWQEDLNKKKEGQVNKEVPKETMPVDESKTVENSEKLIIEIKETSEHNSFSLGEVSLHGEEGDCWIAINNKVYDISLFVSEHPGGKGILKGCGKDATELFESKHSDSAKETLEQFYLGELSK